MSSRATLPFFSLPHSFSAGIGARRIEITEEHRVFHASTVYFHAGKVQSRRTASIGPGVAYANDFVEDYDWDDPYLTSYTPRNHDIPNAEVESQVAEGYFPQRPLRSARRVSVDGSYYHQRSPVSHHEEMETAPIPPYSPFAPDFSDHSPVSPATSSGQISTLDGNPAQSLEEFRSSLQSSMRSVVKSESFELLFMRKLMSGASPINLISKRESTSSA